MLRLDNILEIFRIGLIHRTCCSLIRPIKAFPFLSRHDVFIYALVFAILHVPSPGDALSLREAKEEALRANLDIKISKEKAAEALFVSKQRYAEFFPGFSATSYGAYMSEKAVTRVEKGAFGTVPIGNFPFPLETVEIETVKNDLYNISLRLEQPVFQGGRIYFSYRQAKANAEEVSWDAEQTVQDMLLRVEEVYFSLLQANERKKFTIQNEHTLKAHLSDMMQLYQNGRVALNDVLKVQVELARASEAVIKANNDVLVLEGQFNLLLNRPLNQQVDIMLLDEPQPVAISIEEAEELAKSNNKALNGFRTKRMTALFKRRVAEADYYPNLTFTAGYVTQNRQPTYPENYWSVMLAMGWSLWQWGETKHKVSAAKAFESQIDYSISSLENQIAAEARNKFLKIQYTDKRIQVVREALTQAQENLRITQIGFANGRKTSTDFLDAEELLEKARFDYLQAFYDAHAARSQLRYAMGEMEKEDFLYKQISSKYP